MAGGAEDLEIIVRNDNFNQVTVYASREGGGRRLGIVEGKNEARFHLRWHLPYLQLRVKYLAGRDFVTERLPVAPGELLELIVPVY